MQDTPDPTKLPPSVKPTKRIVPEPTSSGDDAFRDYAINLLEGAIRHQGINKPATEAFYQDIDDLVLTVKAREDALRTNAYEDGFIAGRVSEAKKCEAAKIHDMKAVRKAERTRVITEAIDKVMSIQKVDIDNNGRYDATNEMRAALQAMLTPPKQQGGHHVISHDEYKRRQAEILQYLAASIKGSASIVFALRQAAEQLDKLFIDVSESTRNEMELRHIITGEV